MKPELLEVRAALQIGKPVHEVFDAIIDPAKMANYFIEKGSGRMEEGKTITWKFPEFDGEFPIKVNKIEKDKFMSFFWDSGSGDNTELETEISLMPCAVNATLVRIVEKSMENNQEGINWLVGNTEGWANFLACMKAYLEFGINLRKGAFDFMKA